VRPGQWIGLVVLRVRQLLRLVVLVYGPMACMLTWFSAMLAAVFAYRDPPPIPYCATVDRMPRHAAIELLLLVAGCVLVPMLAAVLIWRGWERPLLVAGCLALAVGSAIVLGLLGITTGDRLVEAGRGFADPPVAVMSPGAVPDLCRQIYPDWDEAVLPAS
jgi:hypothetical protein